MHRWQTAIRHLRTYLKLRNEMLGSKNRAGTHLRNAAISVLTATALSASGFAYAQDVATTGAQQSLPATAAPNSEPRMQADDLQLPVPGEPDLEAGPQIMQEEDIWETGGRIVGVFPIVNCGYRDTTLPWTIMRQGWVQGAPPELPRRMGFVKANEYHGIADPLKLWHRTLGVAQLGDGCQWDPGRGGLPATVAQTKFLGFSCTWGERFCAPNPSRTMSVRSLERNQVFEQFPGLPFINERREGNISLYCLNEDRAKECPHWIHGALPYAPDDPDDF